VLLYAVYLAVALGVTYLVFRYLLGYLLPFVIALVLALVIDPPVRWMERRLRLPRGVAVLVAMGVMLIAAGGLLWWAGATLVRELGALVRDAPVYYERVAAWTQAATAYLGRVMASLPEPLRAGLQGQEQAAYNAARVGLATLLQGIMGAFTRLPGALAALGVGCLAAFFLSRDRDVIARAVRAVVPPAWRGRFGEAQRQVLRSAMGLINAQLALVGLVAALTAAGLLIMGAPYGLLLGLLAGVLDLVPFLGPGAVLGPWGLFCLIDGRTWFGCGLLLLLVVVMVVRQVVEVRLVGRRTGIHPLGTLLALYFGAMLFGPVGLFLGPLIAIVVRAVVVAGLVPGGQSRAGGGRGAQ